LSSCIVSATGEGVGKGIVLPRWGELRHATGVRTAQNIDEATSPFRWSAGATLSAVMCILVAAVEVHRGFIRSAPYHEGNSPSPRSSKRIVKPTEDLQSYRRGLNRLVPLGQYPQVRPCNHGRIVTFDGRRSMAQTAVRLAAGERASFVATGGFSPMPRWCRRAIEV
jgi:hypothetical protein